ncbi:MAG: Eco57I restriction-modification methylase domain-containing protein [Candidatus Acidiferrales bacterium]
MIPAQRSNAHETLDPVLRRRLSELREVAAILKKLRLSPIETCQNVIDVRVLDLKTRSFFAGLPEHEKHYWISSLYALLIPPARRRKLAAYFTPPHLAQYAIDVLIDAGIEPGKDRILDPASGGAAFLVPLAARVADEGRRRRMSAEPILRRIESSLAGVEIEPDLAQLSRIFLSNLLRTEIRATGRSLRASIKSADTLRLSPPHQLFDAVIGNPPYGRVLRPSKPILKDFAGVISHGHVNLYALFLERALRWVRPGGIVCFIIPMSFIGGPYFSEFRKRILETADILRLDPIDKRSDVFHDVLCDVCVIALRRKGSPARRVTPRCSLLMTGGPNIPLGNLDLPASATGRVWALPDRDHSGQFFCHGLETLEDYGYITKTGYFVWNREQHRYRVGRKPKPNEVPLYWAHNVVAGKVCNPCDDVSSPCQVGFVKMKRGSSAVVQSDAIILQRTSNRRQRRRVVAGIIREAKVPGERGFVTENHTIVIVPDPRKKQQISLTMLCRLLNTATVDARFRRISGSASVSTKALAKLPLPAATDVRAAFKADIEIERAIDDAYAQTTNRFRSKSISARGEG